MSNSLCKSSVFKAYQDVIVDVITNIREHFLEDGVDETVLQELKSLWETKLSATKAVEEVKEVDKIIAVNNKAQKLQQQQQQQQNYLNQIAQQQSQANQIVGQVPPNNHIPQGIAFPEWRRVPVQLTIPSPPGSSSDEQRVLGIEVPEVFLQGHHLKSILTGPIISATMNLPIPAAAAFLQDQVNNAFLKHQQSTNFININMGVNPSILQADGSSSSSGLRNIDGNVFPDCFKTRSLIDRNKSIGMPGIFKSDGLKKFLHPDITDRYVSLCEKGLQRKNKHSLFTITQSDGNDDDISEQDLRAMYKSNKRKWFDTLSGLQKELDISFKRQIGDKYQLIKINFCADSGTNLKPGILVYGSEGLPRLIENPSEEDLYLFNENFEDSDLSSDDDRSNETQNGEDSDPTHSLTSNAHESNNQNEDASVTLCPNKQKVNYSCRSPGTSQDDINKSTTSSTFIPPNQNSSASTFAMYSKDSQGTSSTHDAPSTTIAPRSQNYLISAACWEYHRNSQDNASPQSVQTSTFDARNQSYSTSVACCEYHTNFQDDALPQSEPQGQNYSTSVFSGQYKDSQDNALLQNEPTSTFDQQGQNYSTSAAFSEYHKDSQGNHLRQSAPQGQNYSTPAFSVHHRESLPQNAQTSTFDPRSQNYSIPATFSGRHRDSEGNATPTFSRYHRSSQGNTLPQNAQTSTSNPQAQNYSTSAALSGYHKDSQGNVLPQRAPQGQNYPRLAFFGQHRDSQGNALPQNAQRSTFDPRGQNYSIPATFSGRHRDSEGNALPQSAPQIQNYCTPTTFSGYHRDSQGNALPQNSQRSTFDPRGQNYSMPATFSGHHRDSQSNDLPQRAPTSALTQQGQNYSSPAGFSGYHTCSKSFYTESNKSTSMDRGSLKQIVTLLLDQCRSPSPDNLASTDQCGSPKASVLVQDIGNHNSARNQASATVVRDDQIPRISRSEQFSRAHSMNTNGADDQFLRHENYLITNPSSRTVSSSAMQPNLNVSVPSNYTTTVENRTELSLDNPPSINIDSSVSVNYNSSQPSTSHGNGGNQYLRSNQLPGSHHQSVVSRNRGVPAILPSSSGDVETEHSYSRRNFRPILPIQSTQLNSCDDEVNTTVNVDNNEPQTKNKRPSSAEIIDICSISDPDSVYIQITRREAANRIGHYIETYASLLTQAQRNEAEEYIRRIIQGDGTADSSDDDEIDDDDEEENENEDVDIIKDDIEEEKEDVTEDEPLNSEDDVSDADGAEESFETENVIVCQFDKITRARNRWKFHLKDGIMNLNGEDYVFQKANGDAEW